jgi:hypothetical protein
MSLSHRYRQLATLIETLETNGISVQQAKPLDDGEGGPSGDDSFSVQLRIDLPTDGDVGPLDVDRPGTTEQSAGTPSEPVGANTAGSRSVTTRDESASAGDDRHTGDSADGDADAVADVEAAATDARDVEADSAGGRADVEAGELDGTDGNDRNDPNGPNGIVSCTHPDCDRTFETERGMKIHRTKAHPLSELAADERDRTVHHDPDVLARVYEEYETFAEMTEALDVDVGAQAVRKQMIRHGIHEPGTGAPSRDEPADEGTSEREAADADADVDADTDTDGDADTDEPRDDGAPAAGIDENEPGEHRESGEDADGADGEPRPQASDETDGESESASEVDDADTVADRLPELDLPGSLSTADLQRAVEEANTLYDVQRALDLDQETTRDVLAEYDLLELVSGRAASLRDREELKAEIDQRIRQAAT